MLLFINYSYKKNYAENSISTLIDHNIDHKTTVLGIHNQIKVATHTVVFLLHILNNN